jgi:probable phosphoglycerate mutase
MLSTHTIDTSNTTRIVLVRHGETAWNAERRLQGHLDIALNAQGERQAQALANALAHESFDLVVSSDLQRARQTAEALARVHAIAVQSDPCLRERCYGGFEGLLYSEIAERYPRQFAAWQARDIDAALPPGANPGETFRQFNERVTQAILGWASAHRGKAIALVAHGGVLECAYRAARGLALDTPRDFKIPNASINRFAVTDGVLALESWGEVAHLRTAVLDELA